MAETAPEQKDTHEKEEETEKVSRKNGHHHKHRKHERRDRDRKKRRGSDADDDVDRKESSRKRRKRDYRETDDEDKVDRSSRRSSRSSRSKSKSSSSSAASEDSASGSDTASERSEGKSKSKRKRHSKRRSETPSSSSETSDEEDASPRPISPTLKLRRRHRRENRASKFDMTPEQAEQLKSKIVNQYAVPNTIGSSMGFSSQNMAHTRHARRIYVGGIGNDVTEADMTTFFNAVIERVYKPIEGGAVVSVYINHERKFAFVELREIALATAAMELDGIPYNGQPLKIRRPNDYNPSAVPAGTEGEIKFDLSKLGIVSTTVEDGPNKVFVGGLPHHLNEKQVQELLQAFGRLKSFHLVRDLTTGTSKGYGFCEFVDPNATDIACEGLNGMQIGDRVLTVRRATAQDNNQGQSVGGQQTWQPEAQAQAQQPSAPPAPSSTAPSKQPTQFLQLCHMVTDEMLSDDQEYQDIVLDVKEECEQYGTVKEIRIPRQGPYSGNIFIHFEGIDQAVAAAAALAGRLFESQLVSAEYVTEEEFNQVPPK